MLFAGWEVRIVKNCDLVSENATLGRTALGRQITFYFFFPAVNWFYRLSQMGFFYATLALNRLAVYETFLKTLRNEGVIQMPDKDVLKKRFFGLLYDGCIYFTK